MIDLLKYIVKIYVEFYKNKKCYYEFKSILLILFSTLKFKFYFNNK